MAVSIDWGGHANYAGSVAKYSGVESIKNPAFAGFFLLCRSEHFTQYKPRKAQKVIGNTLLQPHGCFVSSGNVVDMVQISIKARRLSL